MSYYKFEQNDIFTNRIKAHPRSYFLINNNKTFYNNDVLPTTPGDTETIIETPQGHISLYEMNINRKDGVGNSNLIYPYITKQGTLNNFSSVSTETFQGFQYGDEISGSYPLAASISTDFYSTSSLPNLKRDRIYALKNTFNYYRPLSNHYAYETTEWNKAEQDIKLISIPSIFYGSSIKKGSVKLNYYIEGELVATLEDTRRNGELVQTFGQITTTSSGGAGGTVAATGSISLVGSGFMLVGVTFTLTDTGGSSETFIFDDQGTLATGDLDGSGFIVVQIFSSTGEFFNAQQIEAAVNSSGLNISASVPNPWGEVILTQDVAGEAGNTQIVLNPSNATDISVSDFSGGEGAGGAGETTTTESPYNGKVAGVVLYNEGFVALTGSWDLSVNNSVEEIYIHEEEHVAAPDNPKWIYWGQKHGNPPDPNDPPPFAVSSSWDIDFLGTNYIPTMTMLAHARQGDLNYSNNPTFIDFDSRSGGYQLVTQEMIDDVNLEYTQEDLGKIVSPTPTKFMEGKELQIANVAQSPYTGAEAAFEKTTYISKIGIYDENKNLIGIAKLATPVRKTESRQYTFKMKVDF